MPHWQLSFAQCAEGRQSPLPQPRHLKVSLNHNGSNQLNSSGSNQLNSSGSNQLNSSGSNQHLLATFLHHWHLEVSDWEDSF
jgi:hypothetical protein